MDKPGNAHLRQAQRNAADEFYTQLSDIEKELYHYRDISKIKPFFATAMIRMKAISLNISR